MTPSLKFIGLFFAFHLLSIANAQTYIQQNNLIEVPATIATAGGTTTLTSSSQTNEIFTGSSNQTVVLPNATTLQLVRRFYIQNGSSGTLTVNYNGGATAATIPTLSQAIFIVTSNGTSAGVWSISGFNVSIVTGVLPVANGGTGQSSLLTNGVIYGQGTTGVATASGSQYQALIAGASGVPAFGALNLAQSAAVTGTLAVGNGGTGDSTLTTNGILYGQGTSGVATLSGTQYQVYQAGASGVPTAGAVSLNQSAAVTGTLPVGNGGTGQSTLTTNGMLYGQGTSGVATLSGTQYQVYQAGAGGVPTAGAVSLNQSSAVTGTLPVANGGTGMIANTQGALLVGTASTSITQVADVATGQVLTSGGVSTNPSYSASPSLTNVTASTQFKGGNGSAATPSYSFTNATNTGMFLAGTAPNLLAFSTTGTEYMRLTSYGAVGIGTQTPNTILDVNGTTSLSAIILPRDSTTNRPTGVNGMIRYNTSLASVEVYQNGGWVQQTVSTPVTVANGGTGVATLSAYTLLAGGTSNTGNVQNVAVGTTSGQVLQWNSLTALPSFVTLTAPTVQIDTSGTGTFTTPTGVQWLKVTGVGGGGAGGGCASTSSSCSAGGGGGGGGGFVVWLAGSTCSGGCSWTVGSGGSSGTAGNNAGGNGNATTFNSSAYSAGGGSGGGGSASTTNNSPEGTSGAGGTSSGSGNALPVAGTSGTAGLCFQANGNWSGQGGASAFGLGQGGINTINTSGAGTGGSTYGGGGAGCNNLGTQSARSGGGGAAGVLIIEQFSQ